MSSSSRPRPSLRGREGGALTRQRLLVLRALGLGDTLTAVPALRALARAYPEHERILAAPAALAPLVDLVRADGARVIDRVVDAAPLAPLPVELHGCELAVNLHGSGPESHRVLCETGPRAVMWFAHPDEPESTGAPVWRPDEHETRRWCRLLEAYGLSADPADLALAPPPVDAAPWEAGVTVIHPGAARAARRWPVERFAAVASSEQALGHRVIITGAASERELAEVLARTADLPADAVLAGRTDLAGLAAGIAHAGRVVCGDTGVAHLATAFGTPSVLLFGPTSPALWGPPAPSVRHHVLWAGWRGDPHATAPDPGLLAITVEEVLAALAELPAPGPVSTAA